MGLLKCNHPLLLTNYRYEVVQPSKEHQNRLKNITCSVRNTGVDHSLVGTSVWPQFHTGINPTSLRRSYSETTDCKSRCAAPGACSGRIMLDIDKPAQIMRSRYNFLETKPPGPSCMVPSTITVLPSNVHNAYRYETKLTENQQPVQRTVEDLRTTSIHPIFRTSYRYNYVRPRPPGASARPVEDLVQQRYACHRYGAAEAPWEAWKRWHWGVNSCCRHFRPFSWSEHCCFRFSLVQSISPNWIWTVHD